MKIEPITIDPDLADLIPDFVSNTLKDCTDIQDFAQKKDFPGIRRICHRVLGTAISYGFVQLDSIVSKIQASAVSEQFEEMNLHTHELSEYAKYLEEHFKP